MGIDRRNFLKSLAAGSVIGLAAGGSVTFNPREALAKWPTGQALNGHASSASPSGTSASVGPYSYLVFYDSSASLYKAMNGMTGAADYSGSNAATVIQSAISGGPVGGSIYIQVGIYSGSGSVTNTNGLSIIAQGGAVFSGFTMPAFARMPSVVTRHTTLTPNGPYDGGDFGPSSS